MSYDPYNTPSCAGTPTENVEEPLRKSAKWRLLLLVMFLPSLILMPLLDFAGRKHWLFEIIPFLRTRLLLNPITTPIAWWACHFADSTGDTPFPLGYVYLVIVFLLCGPIEWYFYGWLLDTWSYRRRLWKASVGPQRARHDGS